MSGELADLTNLVSRLQRSSNENTALQHAWATPQANSTAEASASHTEADSLNLDLLQILQQTLQENEWLKLVLAHMLHGVVITDPNQPDNPIIFANAAFYRMTGYTEAEVIGRNCRFLSGAGTDPEAIATLREAIAQQRPVTCSLLNYRKDGTPFWNEVVINPVFDQSGHLIYFVGLQSDITARKHIEGELERLRHRNELILNSAGEGIYGLDQHGKTTFVNPAAARMLGWQVDELIGQPISTILADPQSAMLEAIGLATGSMTERASHIDLNAAPSASAPTPCFQDGQIHHANGEVFRRKDGTIFPVEYISTPIWENGQLLGTVILFQDITDRKRSEEALRDSEERYALAVQGANDGIWDWNVKTGEVYYSPRWKAMLGYAEDEIGNTLEEWVSRVHPDDRYWMQRELEAHLNGLTPHFEHEHRVRHRNGSYRWFLSRGLAVRDTLGKATRLAGSQTDITGRKHVEEQLLHDAFHDVLTGLPNRALLMDRLRQSLELARKDSDYLFAVLFLDIDRFKLLNDSLGHMTGDCLLVAIAQRLAVCLRPGDTIARLGGDEFVILLDRISALSNATAVADRIQRELSVPFKLAEHEIFTSASIGIALGTADYEWSEDLLRDADTAMYRAKAHGKARYEVFDRGMHLRAVALLQLENDLRRALDRQEFRLCYQPIVSLRDLRILGFEALIRWHHSERGVISPTEFIPIAEETGLIVPIGHWALYEACRQMQDWHQRFPMLPPLMVQVNVSGKQFSSSLVEEIEQILVQTRLRPNQLKLELTESILMENAEQAVSILKNLKHLGLQLSIDDFGTGYSSLSYLHRFPIDTLKVDRSFINKLDSDGEQLAIVRTIMTLAWNLGIDVVAEGVETGKQLAQLKSLQCDAAQGYFFAAPLDPIKAEQLLSGEPPWRQQKSLASL